MLNHSVLDRTVLRLKRRASLEDADRDALKSLEYKVKTFLPRSYIVCEGAAVEESALLLAGFAFRQKVTQDGDRQIVSFHIPGDFVGLEGSLLNIADHNVQALTLCEVASIPMRSMISLINTHPKIGHALWIETLIDASIYREWVMNVGQRPAKQRIAHLLCELAQRLKVAGLGDESGYQLPMTQEQLADATGLTPVHANRSFISLRKEGLIVREGRFIRIPDWDRLRDAAGFNEVYLHLKQAA